MDWFGTLIKVTEGYFSTNGLITLIVIVLTASITTILGYAIPAFGRFIWRLLTRLRWRFYMFREWYHWKRFHPDYSFTPMHPAIISEVASDELVEAPDKYKKVVGYQISIDMHLCIKNNHDMDSLFLHCGQGAMNLQMYSGRRAKYALSFSSSYVLHKIRAQDEEGYDFTLKTDIPLDIKPKLGSEVHCDKINIGIAQLSRMRRNLRGKPFDVKVDWSKIQLHGETK